MSDVVTPLLEWLNANPHLAGLVTFLISAGESVAVLGTLIPGSITMTAIGTLAGAGVIPLWSTIIWAILGAVLGDGISYWIGHYFKDRLRNMWPFKNNPSILGKGEVYVHKYGVMSVFLGRFVGPIRAMVPVVAGMLGMKPLHFTLANITSAILWAPIYMLPGILLGAASLELPPDIAVQVLLVLFMMALFFALCFWLAYKVIWLARNQIEYMLNKIWAWLKKSRYFHITTTILKHHDPKQHHGQLTLAFYFLLSAFLLLMLCCYVRAIGAEHIFINDALFHFYRSIRASWLDSVMISISLLGQKQIILPVVLVLFCWLVIKKRTRAAFHALALGILAASSVYLLKQLIQSPRPWGIMNSPETFSMPSGHTTLATTVYLGIAFMIARTVSQKKRWLIYLPATLAALAVGFSRVYLGAHWFTDVLAAWLLSTALLILVILSYNRQREKPINLIGISLVSFITLFFTYSYYHYYHFERLKADYSMAEWPTLQIPMQEWWKKDELLPALNVSLFGFPSQSINIAWTGSLEQIEKSLIKRGWSAPPKRDWISTLHRIADVKSGEYLPLVSPQYLDKQPVIVLAKRIHGNRKLLVLRLWASNRIIKETNTPLWVGTVGIIPRSYSWIFKKESNVTTDPTIVVSNQTEFSPWEWHLINVKTIDGKVDHKILLLRKK